MVDPESIQVCGGDPEIQRKIHANLIKLMMMVVSFKGSARLRYLRSRVDRAKDLSPIELLSMARKVVKEARKIMNGLSGLNHGKVHGCVMMAQNDITYLEDHGTLHPGR